MPEHNDQKFLEFVVKSLVDHPDKVKIDRITDDMGVLLTLDTDPEDMGKVIGRQGNTAKSIRTLLRVVGMKNSARVNLKINEPEGGRRPSTYEGDRPRMENRDTRDVRETRTSSHPQPRTTPSVDDVMEDLKGI